MKFCLFINVSDQERMPVIRELAKSCNATDINNSTGLAPTFETYEQLANFVKGLGYWGNKYTLYIEDKHFSKKQREYVQKIAQHYTRNDVQCLITEIDRIPDVLKVYISEYDIKKFVEALEGIKYTKFMEPFGKEN